MSLYNFVPRFVKRFLHYLTFPVGCWYVEGTPELWVVEMNNSEFTGVLYKYRQVKQTPYGVWKKIDCVATGFNNNKLVIVEEIPRYE